MNQWIVTFSLVFFAAFMLGQLSGMQYHRHLDRIEGRCYRHAHSATDTEKEDNLV